MTVLAKPPRPLTVVGGTQCGVTIETRRLRLVALCLDDKPALMRVFNDPLAARMAHDICWPFDDHAADKKLSSLMRDPQNSWAIRNCDDEMIGLIYLSDVACGQAKSLHDFGPNVSLYIAPMHRGFGYGTEALEAVLDYLKTQRGIKIVQAAHFSDNEASGHALTMAGLLYTGRRTFESSLARPQKAEARHMIIFL